MCQPVYILTAIPIIFGRYFSISQVRKVSIRKWGAHSPQKLCGRKPVFILGSVWLQSFLLFFLLLREKLTEVHEELQKKQELIEDLQPDVNQNGRYLSKPGSKDLPFLVNRYKNCVCVFGQSIDTYIANKYCDNF